MANAFCCAHHDYMDNIDAERIDNQTIRQLLHQRRTYFVVQINAHDGPLYVHPGTGCLQGDKNAGDDFCDVFQLPLSSWP